MTPRFAIRASCLFFPGLFLVASCADSPETSEDHTDAINAYIDLGLNAYDSADYNASQLYFDSAHYLVNEKTDTALRLKLLFNQTEILKLRGDYDTCLTNYYSALELAQMSRDTSREALAHYNIASVNFYLGQYDKCLKTATNAMELYNLGQNSGKVANCYALMAIALRAQGSTEHMDYLRLALEHYEKAKDYRNIAIVYNNIANSLRDEEEYAQAVGFYREALVISAREKDVFNQNITCGNLGESLIDVGEFKEARMYIDSSLRMSEKLGSKESIELNYERLANWYTAMGNKDSALLMQQKRLDARTDRLKIEADVLIKSMESDHANAMALVQSQADVEQLESEKARGRLILWFVIGIALLIILGAYILVRKQRQIRRIDQDLHAEEKKSLEAETALKELIMKEQEAAQRRLEEELDFKRQELMKFSLTISEREEFLASLRALIKQIKPGDTQKPEIIRELQILLQGSSDEGKTELYRQINEMNQSFVFNLKRNYPSLNEDDIRLASLLLIDLSSKEIADILSIEAKSVDMKRYRLKKKLDLDAETDLKTFLQQI